MRQCVTIETRITNVRLRKSARSARPDVKTLQKRNGQMWTFHHTNACKRRTRTSKVRRSPKANAAGDCLRGLGWAHIEHVKRGLCRPKGKRCFTRRKIVLDRCKFRRHL